MTNRYYISIVSAMIVLFSGPGILSAQEMVTKEEQRTVPSTLKEIVHFVLENNNTVRLQQLEILKSDTEKEKDDSLYTPVVRFSYQGFSKTDKETSTSILQGTKTNQNTYQAGISKLFSTGTFVDLQVQDQRFDNNAGEGRFATGLAASFAQEPIHTGSVQVSVSQELLKNSFGYSLRRKSEIARNVSAIQREATTFVLSQLVVKAMIDYWNLSIAEEAVKTQEILLRNTVNLRNITARKTTLGLAEAFEVNQWNALQAQAETALQRAILDRNNKKRELLRTMNLDPATELTGTTALAVTMPDNLNPEQDIQDAWETRPDLKNISLQRKNAKLAAEMAQNNLLPSVTIAGRYASTDKGRHARTAYYEVPNGKYPESAVEFKVQYPIGDDGARVDARNAKLALRQLDIQEEDIKRKIEDEIRNGYDNIKASYEIYKKAEYASDQTEDFYNRLVARYRQGRFTAESVKQALDALVQSRMNVLSAKIGFNIAIVNYDMIRNKIWENFEVDIESVLDRY